MTPILGLFGVLAVCFSGAPAATAATSNYLNFQARLMTAAGSIVPDGNYDVQFKIYDAASGGTLWWTETRDYNSGSPDNRVRVTDGYLTVNLGSVNAFPANMPWNQQLWLTMNIGGTGTADSWDGEMSPRILLTAVPHAFTADQIQNSAGSTLLTTSGNQVSLPSATGSSSALTFGGDSTADLYRSASGTLKTDGNFNVAGNISGSGTINLTGTGTSSIMGALGIGVVNPQGALTIANSAWINSVDAAGTGNVNILQVNSNNQIQLGAALAVDGGIVLPTDAGQVTFSDLPIDSSVAASTPESYTMRVGSTNALTVYGESDGAGGVQNVRIGIGSTITPGYTLDVSGDANVSGVYRVGGVQISSSNLSDHGNLAYTNVANNFTQSQTISAAGGKTTLQLSSSSSNTGITFGGDSAADIYRSSAGTLALDGSLQGQGAAGTFIGTKNTSTGETAQLYNGSNAQYLSVVNSASSDWLLTGKVTGDANQRFIVQTDGTMTWSDGTNSADTNLYRSGAGILTTDGNLTVGGAISANNGLTSNLVLDPQFTNLSNYWTFTGGGSAASQVNTSLPNGDIVNALDMNETGVNLQAVNGYVPVNPYKTYRFTIWVNQANGDSSIYFGMNAYNSSKSAVNTYSSSGTGGTNNYFWGGGDITPAGTWKKLTGYILPCNTANGWANPPDTSSSNYRMDCTTAFLKLRFLNYDGSGYGTGSGTDAEFALPSIEEVQSSNQAFGINGSDYVINPQSGNVGIGTLSPKAKLDVSGTGNVATFGSPNLTNQYISLRDGGSGGGYLGLDTSLNSGGGGYVLQAGTNKTLNFYAGNDTFGGNTPQVTLLTNGRLGIGATNPQASLQITDSQQAGSIPAAGTISNTQLYVTNSDTNYGLLGGVLTNGNVYLQAQRSTGAATVYNMLLQPNGGNVGINTTSVSTYQLNVGGSANATTVYQNGNQVCDTSGNCVGTGGTGSGIGGSGTAGKIALFTGSGYTIGDSILAQSGTTVTSSGYLNATTGLQTNATTRIDNSGNIVNVANITSSGNIILTNGGVNAYGYQTTNTSSTYAGQWTLLGTCSLTAQYQDCHSQIEVVNVGDGTQSNYHANVDFRVKQQAAMAANPYVEVEASDLRSITADQFEAVMTQNDASATVVGLYMKINNTYQVMAFNPLINTSGSGSTHQVQWLSNQGYSASLPTGVGSPSQFAATYSNAILDTVSLQPSVDASNVLQVTNASGSNILSVDTSASNGNIVSESDMESSSLVSADWASKGTATVSQTTAQYWQGSNSVQAVISASTSGIQTSTFTTPILPSTQYQMTFYARCSSSISTLNYGRQDVSGTNINGSTTSSCNNSGWNYYTWHFTTGATITSPNIYINMGSATTGTLYVDAVSLIQTTTSAFQPYENGAIQVNGVINTPTIIMPTSNSTTAFQVANAAGTTQNLTVDTLNNRIKIGSISDYGSTLSVSGTDIFRTTSNNIAGFQVQNSSAARILNIDTSTTVNKIANGDLEGNSTSGWAVKNGATLSQVTTQAWNGNYSLQVASTTSANSGTSYSYTMTASTQYTLSLYAKVASGSINDFEIGHQDVSGTDIDCLSGQTLTTSWQRFSCTFTTGSTITSSNIYTDTSGSVAETFFIDGVQLQLGANTTPFNAGGGIQFGGVINSPTSFQNNNDSTTAFQIQNAAGTSNLFVADTQDNQIGIGATPANSLLTVGGNTTAASGGLTFGTDTSLYRGGNNALQTDSTFTVNGGAISVINAGDAVLNLTADTDNVNETDNPTINFSQDGAGVTGYIGLDQNNDFNIIENYGGNIRLGNTGSTTQLVIDSGGRVGIGANPSTTGAKLQVNGTISATSNIGFTNTGNAQQSISLNMVVTSAVSANQVLIIDTAHQGQVTTTSAGNIGTVFGIATTSNSAGVAQPIVTSGVYQVMADSNAVSIGDTLVTSSTTTGDVASTTSPSVGAALGQALSAKGSGSPGLVWVKLAPGTGSGDYTPVGTLSAYSGGAVPSGWLTADGSSMLRSAYPDLFNVLVGNRGTTTLTIASPGVFTLNSHGLSVGDKVFLETTGALPTGLSADTTYCVSTVPNANTFTLGAYTQSTQSCSTTPINTSGTQSGTHTLYFSPYGVPDSTHFYLPDLRGRTVVGVNTTNTFVANLGNNENAVIGSRQQKHSSTYVNPTISVTAEPTVVINSEPTITRTADVILSNPGYELHNVGTATGDGGGGGDGVNAGSVTVSQQPTFAATGGSYSLSGGTYTATGGSVGVQTNAPVDSGAYLTTTYMIKAGASVSLAASNGFIQNGTSTQTGNFNIQGSGTGNVVAVIQGSSGQTADILDVKDSSNNKLLAVDASGNLSIKGNIGFANTGNANQAFTISENITGSVTAGDVVVIDTANAGYVTDASTANSTQVVGIATKTQTGGSEPIVISGVYQVNVGSNTPSIGNYLVTDGTTAGEATGTASPSGGVVGQVMSTATSSKVWALVKPQSGAGGGSGSGSSSANNYGLMESDWTDTNAALPSGAVRESASLATIGNTIYMFGGSSGGTYSNSIYSAPVSNPTSWTLAGTIAPATNGLALSQVAIIGSTIYLFGGQTNSGLTNSIYSAPVSSPTNWSSVGTIAPATGGISWSQLAIIGSTIYLFGGNANNIYTASVSNPLSWTLSGTIAPAPNGISQDNVAVIGNYIYMFGGYDSVSGVHTSIYRAPVSNPLSWSSTTGVIPGPRAGGMLSIIGNYVYMFGGYNTNTNNTIYRAPLNNPVKGWGDAGSLLPTNLAYSQPVIAGNAVYLVGGRLSGGTTDTGEIYSAPIYNGSPDVSSNPSWITDSNYSSGGGSGTSSQTTNNNYELDYEQYSSGNITVNSTNQSSPNPVLSSKTITTDGNTPIMVEFSAMYTQQAQGDDMCIDLWDGATDLGQIAEQYQLGSYTQFDGPISGKMRLSPSAGSHTYAVKAWLCAGSATEYISTGTGGGSWTPAFLRITLANPYLQGGSGIANGTTTQTANFNVQSSAANNVTAVIQGATSQSADILEVKDSSNTNLLAVDASGNLTVKGTIGFANQGNANQGITLNIKVTSAVNAGDVVVIDTSNAGQVTDSTSANSTRVFGIATQTKTAGQYQPIVISGLYQVNVGSNSVNVGDYLVTDTNTGEAQSSSSPSGGIVGQAMSTASSSKVWALIKPQSGAGGGSGSSSSSNYGLMESDFTSAGTMATGALAGSSTVTVGNYIYLLGGRTGTSTYTNHIFRASVSNPTSWSDTGNTLPTSVWMSQVAIIGSNVYLFGGSISGTATRDVYYESLTNLTNNVASWTTVTNALPAALSDSQVAVVGSNIYLYGGANSSGVATNVIYTATTGSPTSWSSAGTLPDANGWEDSSVAVIGNYVYLFGGRDSSARQTTIYRALVSSPTNFSSAGNLNATADAGSLVIIGNYIYLLAFEDNTGPTHAMQRASINNPTGWSSLNLALPGLLELSSAVIAGNALYLFGGNNGSFANVMYSAPIYNGSPDVSSNPSWKVDSNAGSGGGSGTSSQTANTNTQLAYAEFSTSNTFVYVNGTSPGAATSVVTSPAATYDGTSPIMVNFYSPEWNAPSTGGGYLMAELYEDSTDLGYLGYTWTNSTSVGATANFSREITPSAGSHTFTIKAWVSSGSTNGSYASSTGGVGNFVPGYIRVTLANPSLQGGTGSGIQNGTTLQTNANFNIQSASASNVTAVIHGTTGQSADILDVQNSSNVNLLSVDPNGNTFVAGNLNVGGTIGFSNIGNQNQGISLNMTVSSTVTAGDVVVIDTTTAGNVTDSTTANSTKVFGIATQTNGTAGLSQPIIVSGIYQVNVDTAQVNIGDYLVTSSTTGKATDSTSPSGGVIGQALSAKSAGSNGTVWARINPSNGAGGSGSGGSGYGLMESDWTNAGGTLSTAAPNGLGFSSVVTIGNYVYMFGGVNNAAGAYTGEIYQAPVSNPTAWVDTGHALPGTQSAAQVAVVGNYVYMFGGIGGGSSAIYKAPVSDPVSSWVDTGKTLPGNLWSSQLAIIGSNLYLFGGESGGVSTNVIYTASISDPTTWSSAGTLGFYLGFSNLAVIGNYVYMFGGIDSSGAVIKSIYRAAISSPTSWSFAGTLPGNISHAALNIVGNYIYLMGGDNGSSIVSSIYRAPINDPVKSWATLNTTLPSVEANAQTAIVGNALYFFGGATSNSNYINTIYSAPIYNGGPDLSSNPSWKVDSNYSSGGGSGTSSQTANTNTELAYAQITSNTTITATTEATANTIVTATPLTADGNTPMLINFYTPYISIASGDAVYVILYDGSNSVGYLGVLYGSAMSAATPLSLRITPSAGSHTYSVRAYHISGSSFVDADTGGSGHYVPAYIRITLANPSLQGGSGIANGTTTQTANFNVQSSSASNVTAVIQGATSQSADILDVRDSSSNNLLSVDASGNLSVKGSIGFSNTGNANQVLTVNEVVTTAVNAGDVVVIDTNNAGQVTTTTLANSSKVFGVATKTMSAGQSQPIAISGIYQVNVDTAAVNLGDYLVTSGTSGKATDSSSPSGGVIGQAMSAKTAGSNGTVWVRLNPGNGAGGSGSGTNYGLMESDFTDTGAHLPEALAFSQVATIGNTVYMFGGYGTLENKIYSAPVSNPTDWTDTGKTLPGNLNAAQLAIVGSNIYLFGGNNGSYTNVIYTASVSDPTTWTDTGAHLPGNVGYGQLVIVGSTIYLYGGYNGGGWTSTIYTASVGSPTVWTTSGSTLPVPMGYSSSAVIGNYIYMFGGFLNNAWSSAIYRAPISNPLSWSSPGNLPVVLGTEQIVVVGNYVYAIGGQNSSSIVNTIYKAPINNPVGGWGPTYDTLPATNNGSMSAIIGNALYIFGGGGSGTGNNIYSAPIYNGSPDLSSNPSWKVDSNVSSGGGGSGTSSQTANSSTELSYVKYVGTTTTTASSDTTATPVVSTPSITYDGSPVRLSFYAPYVSANTNAYVNITFTEDGSVLGTAAKITIGSISQTQVAVANMELTPTPGAHTFAVGIYVSTGQGSVTSGNGGSGQFAPGYLRVTLANPSIQGGSGINNGTATQTGNINLQSSSQSSPTLVVQGATSQSADILDIKSGTGTILLGVTAAGKVNIGTSGTGFGQLEVNSTERISAGGSSHIDIRGGSDGGSSSSIYLYNPAGTLATVIGDGTYGSYIGNSLGVGTGAPGATLDVLGVNNGIRVTDNGGAGQQRITLTATSGSTPYTWNIFGDPSSSRGGLYFANSITNPVTAATLALTTGGNVCINTYTCTHTLGVNGSGVASGGFSTGTPDVAEYIDTSSGVGAADLVIADPTKSESVTRTSTPYDGAIVGVIADGTSGFQMLNAHYGSNFNANSDTTDPNAKPMTVTGRVPVKISDENGLVKPGDYLTSASTPGYAMKATHAGPTIGKALGFFGGGDTTNPATGTTTVNGKTYNTGKVLVLVNLSYYDPVSSELQGNALDATNTVVSGNLEVDGNAVFKGDIAVEGHIVGNQDTSGTITVSSGGSSATYNFGSPYASTPKVIVTPDTDTGGLRWWVTKSTSDFTVHLSSSAPNALNFDYMVQQSGP